MKAKKNITSKDFTIRELHLIENSDVADKYDELVKRCVENIYSDPFNETARKVTMVMNLIPGEPDAGGAIKAVVAEFDLKMTTPRHRRSTVFRAKSGYRLGYEPTEPTKGQAELDFDPVHGTEAQSKR